VRPVPVVVTDVDAQDPLELAAVEDQQPIEALTPDAADPPLAVAPLDTPLDRGATGQKRRDSVDPFGERQPVHALLDRLSGIALPDPLTELRLKMNAADSKAIAAAEPFRRVVWLRLNPMGRLGTAGSSTPRFAAAVS
jgi:hypothetical protein